MERTEVLHEIEEIVKDILDLDDLTLTDDMRANDVPGWDSLAHITIISEIEECFDIRFSMQAVLTLQNIGEMVNLILEEVE